MKKYILTTILLFLSTGLIFSQRIPKEVVENFYFDVVVFQGDTLNTGRVDVYVLVPYQTLNFVKSGGVFGASYDVDIRITDTLGNRIESSRYERTLREEDYFVTRGGTAGFDYTQSIFNLMPGKYRVNASITDKFSKQLHEKNRIITVLDFGEFDFSLSGILLLSSIEDIGGKFKITPHISDNIGNFSNGFFAFFESYKPRKDLDSVDYVWEFINSKNETIAFSDRIRKFAGNDKNQTFIHIPRVDEMTNGTYILRITAKEKDTTNDLKSGTTLAVTQRSVTYLRTIGGSVLADLDIAVRQLRYVAFGSDIDFINEATTTGEKQKRFEAFWKKLDPSPGTDRNEAFEDYYSRIDYANRAFKSFQDGWLTDKGMVYIIFGPPYSTDRQNNFNDGRIYERWSYMNNREFIFVDNSGFGDFRMIRPMSITEKYRYDR
ncbi:MAG: GWxTD domain-containing protein [Candidatus Kapabacteria bacterium]|nr:GWxTD domain-containing protein [Ignavibacteriota bacterium]MCW5886262.1 GWxTD domain-containing protein [Candidatus Kapabacteria bacterium]